jgi:hypothetical protein
MRGPLCRAITDGNSSGWLLARFNPSELANASSEEEADV